MADEADIAKEYADAGVDLPELKDAPAEEKAAPEKEPAPEPKAETPEAPKEPLQDKPKEPEKPRTIYDDYQDRKKELKAEKEARETAEKQRDELQAKLDALGKADTPQERKDAQDEIDAFMATHKEWDKAAIKELIDLARAGTTTQIDETIKKDLDEFKAWKAANSKVIEQQRFDQEFASILPGLKDQFPNVSDGELAAIKTKLDEISHTKEWHDKSLDYVAYKHSKELGALVSPKKRGMESKGKHEVEHDTFEFDPNVDLSKLSAEQREKWEAEYAKLTKSDGLLTDATTGKKIII